MESLLKTAGLTGAPGCGKSTALKFFADLGWKTIDADAICTALHANPESDIHEKMAGRWGARVLCPDGSTEKKIVAAIVFADESERRWLEHLLHPAIGAEVKRQFETMPSDSNVMFDAAILYESGWDRLVSKVIAIWADKQTQMKRLLARGWSESHARDRIASQLPADVKLERADYGLINNGSLDELRLQCIEFNKNN